MSASIASPPFVFSLYFLSQMSAEAGCIGISCSALSILTASRRTVLMLLLLLVVAGSCPVLVVCCRRGGGSGFHGKQWKRRRKGARPAPAELWFSPAVTGI